MKRILLMGNPNVGKSVVFSRLTGANVLASNYPGTTVEFTRGYLWLRKKQCEMIDVPGTYSLDATTPAEEVAVKMLKEGDVVINIIDSTCLERNLNLTLQLINSKKPVIVALNMWDSALRKGIKINYRLLEKLLGIPVVPTCALSGEGIATLVKRIPEAKGKTFPYREEEKWQVIGEIVERVQKVSHRHPGLLETLGDITIHPVGGIPVAIAICLGSFWLIRILGESLIGFIMEPIFLNFWAPLMKKLSDFLNPESFLQGILIGKLVGGEIDFVESLGVLTTGLFVPFSMVLPYVFAFYLVLSFLEDIGYLPRFGVLVDNLMHRLGLHGLAIVPMMLGLGCNVPGALSTRILETRKERFIAATLMAIAVPCMAQIAMVMGLVGKYGIKGIGSVFLSLSIIWIGLGLVLKRTVKGEAPEILMEIPPYRVPYWKALLKKLSIRVRQFITEAVPWVLFGVFIINVLYTFRIIQFMGKITSPLVTGILGLPPEAVTALTVGFLRKDVAVGMLLPLKLNMGQLTVASVVLTAYFPCAATFAVLLRELGFKDMVKSALIMILIALGAGAFLNFIIF